MQKNSPKEKSTKFAATATAAPLDDPPGIRAGAAGFVGVSKCLCSPLILYSENDKKDQQHEKDSKVQQNYA